MPDSTASSKDTRSVSTTSSGSKIPSKKVSMATVVLAFGCVYVFWGSTYTAIRIGGAELPPFVLTGVRFSIAGALLMGWCRMRGLRLMWPRRVLGTLLAVGLLLLGAGNVGLVFAEQSIPSGFASLIYAAVPIFVALLEMLLPRGEPLPARGWLGILLGFGGLGVLLWPSLRQGIHAGKASLLGISVCLAGSLAWACGSLFSRRARLPVNSFVAAAWQMVFAGVFNLLAATVLGEWPQAHWNFAAVGSVVWLITGGSLIGYSSYIYLLEHVPVAKVATYAYINPIIAVLLGMVLLHERLEATEMVGMAAIVVAVAVLTSAQVGKGTKSSSTPVQELVAPE